MEESFCSNRLFGVKVGGEECVDVRSFRPVNENRLASDMRSLARPTANQRNNEETFHSFSFIGLNCLLLATRV